MTSPLPVYTLGTLIEIDATFTDGNNALVDPTTVTGEILQPDGTILQNLTPQKLGTGTYALTFDPTQKGLHVYKIAGAGVVEASKEGSFMVQSQF